jgi:NAD(P)-dependent dehydrogenase (short-subunit alcohol dehydrogenase family)
VTGSLAGKFALVTGASRGIGRAIACELAERGAAVAVHYGRREQDARATVDAILAKGGTAFAAGADLADVDTLAPMVNEVMAEAALLGFDSIDILVNNAGIGGGGALGDLSAAALDRLYAVNVRAPFLLTSLALDRVQDGGRIINLSSMVSLAAYPGAIGYAATKAAINSFTRSLAADLGRRNITVNAVAPGATATDFIRSYLEDPASRAFFEKAAALGRIGEAGDIASVVAFLASDDGRWITGQVLQCSGGMHL